MIPTGSLLSWLLSVILTSTSASLPLPERLPSMKSYAPAQAASSNMSFFNTVSGPHGSTWPMISSTRVSRWLSPYYNWMWTVNMKTCHIDLNMESRRTTEEATCDLFCANLAEGPVTFCRSSSRGPFPQVLHGRKVERSGEESIAVPAACLFNVQPR